MSTQSQLEARHQARAAQRAVDAGLIQLHERALAALRDPERRESSLRSAREAIAVWESKQLCNRHYIDAWRALMAHPLDQFAAEILAATPEAVALRQNSPFGFLVRQAPA